MKRIKIKELLSNSSQYIDTQITLKGWVRTKRGNKHVAFVALNDGSTIHTIQIVLDVAKFSEEQLKDVTTGACIGVTGKLVQSQGAGQSVEVQGDTLV